MNHTCENCQNEIANASETVWVSVIGKDNAWMPACSDVCADTVIFDTAAANRNSEICLRLAGRGLVAHDDFGPSPTEFYIPLFGRGEGERINFACGFNTEGWEAQHDLGGDNGKDVEDGPSAGASVEEIVEWAVQAFRSVAR